MHEQLALFPDSEITLPELPATPTFRILPLPTPTETNVPQAETLPFSEDAA